MLELYMSEILISIILFSAFLLVSFSMFIMYKTLKDTRTSDLELVKKFADMLLAGDYKSYETFKDYNERSLAMINKKPKQVDTEQMAIDNITRNIR